LDDRREAADRSGLFIGAEWLTCPVLLRLLLRIVVLAVIIGLVAAILPGINVQGGFAALLWIAIIFAVVNAILGPIFRLLGLPLVILTLGLFLLVIDAALLAITAGLSSHLAVDNFWWAVLGGFLIAVFSAIAELLLPLRPKHRVAG
jgi:putative membrane protein